MKKKEKHGSGEFMKLLEPLREELLRFARRAMVVKDDAEDVLQEAVMSSYAAFERFELGTQFRPWIYKFLVNKIMNANQKAHRSIVNPVGEFQETLSSGRDQASDQPSVLREPERFMEGVGDELYRALQELSPIERTCLLLRSSEDFTYREIADFAKIPIGTVMSHIFRGRAKVRSHLAVLSRQEAGA